MPRLLGRFRLVSLWEIMKPFRAQFFLQMSALSGLLDFKGKLLQIGPDKNNPYDDANKRAEDNNLLVLLENECIELGLTASLATVRKLRRILAKEKHENEELYPLGHELQERLIDEMAGKSFWSLTIEEAEYYNNPKKGWEEIVNRFPDTISDVEEMSKCFALSRYPAAVFHSLQVIEAGVIKLGQFIEVSDPKPGWSATLNELNRILKKNYNDLTLFEKEHRDFFEQVKATIEALNNAWRNKISHVNGKLKLMTADFSPEIAEEILFATRAFMRRLADGLPPTE
jgi:hypothetical protein